MLSIAIDLCKNIIDLVKKEREVKLEEKLRISSILEEISNILIDTSNKIKSNEYPHYNCILMEKMANELHFHLLDHVSPQELDNLHQVLKEASQVEKQFAQRENPETLIEIDKAAAEFKALSMFMKI